MGNKRVRRPAVAGLFYPSKSQDLQEKIRIFLRNAEFDIAQDIPIIGIISPHAGYDYSGPVAGFAYKSIASLQPERIIIIGPSHRKFFKGCSVCDIDMFETPLGEVPVDRHYSDMLSRFEGIQLTDSGHKEEHSLEVQLPFLQTIYHHPFSIVPIAMGSQDPQSVEDIANALFETWDENQLLVVSTDLSHFYSDEKAIAMDSTFSKLLADQNIPGLWNALNNHRIEACGFGGVVVLLEILQRFHEHRLNVLQYAHSGDVTGDMKKVVGYLAAVAQGTLHE